MSNKEFESAIRSIEFKFENLAERVDLAGAKSAVEKIEHGLRTLPDELGDLERRGFVHTRPLRSNLANLSEDWAKQKDGVRKEIESLKKKLFRDRSRVKSGVQAFTNKPSAAGKERAESAVKTLDDAVGAAESRLRELYGKSSAVISRSEHKIKRITWMLDQIDESPDVNLLENEGPLLAVEAEWENDGDEGPDGVLYLTDQRLIFEEKAEKVTKKFLFITRESELIQQLLISEPISEIQEVDHSEEKRRMIQLRKDDILELVMSSHAAHSRLRFHVQGQESKDWAVMINRAMDGDVFKDRADSARPDAANQREKSFPAECPDCFAAVPPQPRGALQCVCDFCGSTVQAG